MRKLFTIIAMMLLWTASMFAQAPQKMAYQAVVRDADGQVVTNQELGVQVSILQGAVDGTSVYSETHTTTSTANGAINIEIGGGKSSDDFSAIDWSKGPFFVQSTTEVNGKSVTVTSQLLSVPYAQYAVYAEKMNVSQVKSLVNEVLTETGYFGNLASIDEAVIVDEKSLQKDWAVKENHAYYVAKGVVREAKYGGNHDWIILGKDGMLYEYDDYYGELEPMGVWKYSNGQVIMYHSPADDIEPNVDIYTLISFSDKGMTLRRRLGDNEFGYYEDYVYGDYEEPVQVFRITLLASPTQGGTVTGDGTYKKDEEVTVTAKPAEGYEFVNWSDGVSTNPRTITVTKDMSLTASFEKNSNTTFGETNGVEYVDLGLPSGNLWATMNIGADKIEAYGDLYSWGETSTKDNYGEDYYSLYKKDETEVDGFTNYIKGYTKYVPKDKASEYGYGGFFDNKTTLDLTDDVAHVKLGGSWRMPTKGDFDELLENCDMVWCTYQGVNGYKFTAKNGKWLFLPAAGTSSSSRNDEGNGYYWSSSLFGIPSYADYLSFSSRIVVGSSLRYFGHSVRAVCPSAR